jgi:hypothetical protein
VRVVTRHRVGRFLDVREAVGVRAHEGADPLGAFELDPRHDVDQHQRGSGRLEAVSDVGQRRGAAHRGADQRERLAPRRRHDLQILREPFVAIAAVGRPAAVTVAAGVEVDDAIAALGQGLRRRAPGVTGLPAAVQQHDRGRLAVAGFGDVGRERDAIVGRVPSRLERTGRCRGDGHAAAIIRNG